MFRMKKVEATFGNDFAIERAEERLSKEGFKFYRKPPLKLVIYVRDKDEIEKLRTLIHESHGYLEPIPTLKEKITGKIMAFFSFILYRGKKKD